MRRHIDVDQDAIAALRRAGERLQRDTKPLFKSIAEGLAEGLRRNLSAAFPPISLARQQIREQTGGGGQLPLHDTGRMASGIKGKVRDDEAYAYAGFPAVVAQGGFTTARDAMIPGKAVPLRQFVFVEPADEEKYVTEIEEFLLDE